MKANNFLLMVLFLGEKNPKPKAPNFLTSICKHYSFENSFYPLKCLHNFGLQKLLSGLVAKIPLTSRHKIVLIPNHVISAFLHRIRNHQLCVPQKFPTIFVSLPKLESAVCTISFLPHLLKLLRLVPS